ncbi:MAG: hypothetical protein Ct9H90mP16_00540 [Candidatus Poseidoniales archaeon]|nr:MAG: hypothetical protein Ct9H90mP16_00540 [Candidatus Poseidoniales archaeon]
MFGGFNGRIHQTTFSKKSIVLDADQSIVWQLISTPGHLNHVHPFCQVNKPVFWEENHHQDELIYLNGMHYIRSFVNWIPMEGYDLLIGEKDGPQSYVVWKLESISESKSQLTITFFSIHDGEMATNRIVYSVFILGQTTLDQLSRFSPVGH